jgi:hypothetical protein
VPFGTFFLFRHPAQSSYHGEGRRAKDTMSRAAPLEGAIRVTATAAH